MAPHTQKNTLVFWYDDFQKRQILYLRPFAGICASLRVFAPRLRPLLGHKKT